MTVALVVTGAPLAGRALEIADALTAGGHTAAIQCSQSARTWVGDVPAHVQSPPGRWSPRAVVVCPATFHTINAVAAGLNDTAVLGVLNDALGRGAPMLFVPTTADRLGGHPAWRRSVDLLTGCGVAWLEPRTGERRPNTVPAGSAADLAAGFDPGWITDWLDGLD